MIARLRATNEWQFAGVLPRADRVLAISWWSVLVLRGLLPAAFAVAMGELVGAVQRDGSLTLPLAAMGVVFIGMQVLSPIHQALGANLGSRTAAWLYDQLAVACVRPPGMGHLENPGLTNDLGMARDFDLGITGPPMSISMDFIASGLVELVGGLASAAVLAAYAWWAPLLVGGAWLSTHWLLRESGVWRDRETDEVRSAQRHADYAYRMAVDPPAAKEVRLFGLADWIIERFRARGAALRTALAGHATARAARRSGGLFVVLVANGLLFASLGSDAARRAPRSRPPRHLRERCDRHQHDRFRRPVVGPRRRRGAGRRGAAPAGRHGARRCALAGRSARHRHAGPGDPHPRPVSSRTRRPASRCSRASTS